ncbi:hypothetical protein HRG_006386 [Hirsutella rhossiliensis]|uniref:Uncharacterized protein n=1 Tax=Hirsutella rhossiliensis TaxID=111463 RepID=A0A9P8SHL5_9HYPO|nr:uncharacterized protein HRG_06386 [Hirsutella rhossiliensis]KAH0962284.1 hypothetical protein HRG_06386 [Hirsutella rhossiliensis]
MKIETFAMAMAFVASTMASPDNMKINDMTSVQSVTVEQLKAMSEQDAAAACSICPCPKKRDLQGIKVVQEADNDQGSSTICLFCDAVGLCNNGGGGGGGGKKPKPCHRGDRRVRRRS